MTIRYKTIQQFAAESGYTEHAIRAKIRDGVWMERVVWKRAPDGHILIDIEGYYRWVENGNGLACEPQVKRRSRSTSSTGASGAGSVSGFSPLPLT